MDPRQPSVSSAVAAAVGAASLAAAVGIGRFAFTPLLPLMQQAFGLTLAQGAWLASANYLGYFLGAAASFVLDPRAGLAARWGLLAIAVSTLATGLTTAVGHWLVLRFVSGVASALVLVGASSWALAHLAAHGKPQASGFVFAGVGVGLFVAGIVALLAGAADPGHAWLLLGALCAAMAAAAWRPLSIAAAEAAPRSRSAAPLARAEWLLVACYGVFGFGYILPATFIPAAARALVNDPAVFGWMWPGFGLAAAASTTAASALFRGAPPRRVAAGSLIVMAVGVMAPVIHMGLASLAVSALCVGGTFMVMTMAGAQEARRIAVHSPSRLIAALTCAFALGQIAGPLLVGIGDAGPRAVALVSGLAAAAMLLSATVLRFTPVQAEQGELP
jgi:MFS family permease